MAKDYRDFGIGTSAKSASVPRQDLIQKWWTVPTDEMPAAIASNVRFIQEHQGQRMTQQLISTRLYGNLSLMGTNGLTYSKMASVVNSLRDRISYNVVSSCIDTVTSKMAKNKPKPLFLTSGGDYKKQSRAKKLNKFIDGVFYANKAHDLGVEIFRDACIVGEGVVHVYHEDGKVKYERILSGELLVDELEGFYGTPRSLYRNKNVDRGVLKAMFPGADKAILEANSSTPDDLAFSPTISDVVHVTESWHLPSGKDKKDGMHVISLNKSILFKEQYDHDHFPFVFFRWNKRPWGYWGQGLAEQIQNIQLEINKILWVIQRSMHLQGSFKVLLENGSKLVKEHFNNDIGALIMYSGVKPEYIVPPIVAPEVYSHLQTLKNAAYEQAGVSQLSASSKKPDGLDSGKALREYDDIESERFTVVGQAYEKFYLDLAHLTIRVAKECYEETGELSIQVPGKKFIESIDWKDAELDHNDYVMKVFPVSSLPDEPAGRLATIQEYAQAGYISPQQAKRLLDFPDLEAEENMANAGEDYLHEILEDMQEEGEYTAPEPYDDLQLARKLALDYYSYGKCQGLEEEKLELYRRFLDQIDVLTGANAPPAGVLAGGGQPQAAPQPPQQSDLIPNSPNPVTPGAQ